MYSRYGYKPTGDTLAMMGSGNPAEKRMGQNLAFAYGREFDQQEHEKGLQAQEQQRRMYDSETQRQKLGLLGNLLSGSRNIRFG